jgi:hypothetical protein
MLPCCGSSRQHNDRACCKSIDAIMQLLKMEDRVTRPARFRKFHPSGRLRLKLFVAPDQLAWQSSLASSGAVLVFCYDGVRYYLRPDMPLLPVENGMEVIDAGCGHAAATPTRTARSFSADYCVTRTDRIGFFSSLLSPNVR